MSLAPGTRIGSYEVTASLGEGGMGEVYRARDSKLKRDVAIKVLPAEVAADRERLARFQREAEVLASLNHPHIAQIYGLEQSGESSALVMELVEGEDLAQRIARGAIPMDEALPIARQTAEALEAAHDLGIVHRDLKPANIKVREDGTVKVLDFGLAKAIESGVGSREPGVGRELANSPTITSPAMTMRGVILGTAAYMSPEQAKGRAVDRRADVWAFGCVLYEMLTGRRAFGGDDVTDTITAVMRDAPDWSVLPAGTPAAIRSLLRRCLEKDPQRRVSHIAVARHAIEDAAAPALETPGGAAPAPGRARGRAMVWWAAAAVVLAAAAGALGYWLARGPQSEPDRTTYRSLLLLPENLNVRAPSQRFALSPDGRYLAYAAAAEGESRIRLWVRPLANPEAIALPGTDGAIGPFWSPDSRFIAFFSGSELRRIAVSGGPPVTICSISTALGMPGTWNADDVIVFVNGSTLARVSARGGTPEAVTTLAEGETNHEFPYFLPDGRHFIYAAYKEFDPSGTFVASLQGGPAQRLMDESSNAQLAGGYLLYARETTLFARPFDTVRRTFTGDAVPLFERVLPNLTSRSGVAFSVSQSGALVYQTALGLVGAGSRLVWSTRSGHQTVIDPAPAAFRDVGILRDGRSAWLVPLDERGRSDLWLLDLARGVRTRVTFTGLTATAVWSPDGRSVLFGSGRVGNLDIFRKDLDGGDEKPVVQGPGVQMPISWSPDGRVMLYEISSTQGTSSDLWTMPLDGSADPSPLAATAFSERWGQFSPDGRWIAYSSDESGRREVYVTRYGAKTRVQATTAGGSYPRWSRDGRELFFHSLDNRIAAVKIDVAGERIDIGPPTPLFEVRAPDGFARFFYDVAPDGRFLVAVPTATTTSAQVNLLVNWMPLASAH